jgi:2-polyprenyl-3-methyl-5-hydroxy-6-metoxy-1,4-benzoquinol methylase
MEKKTYNLFSAKESGGDAYSKYRPEYPKFLFNKLESICKDKESYLDIASGTGQLFLKLHTQFSGLKVANDLSSVQLQTLHGNLGTETSNIKILCCDAMDIKNQLPSQKFDVITIGEAFHWLESEEILTCIKNDLLKENGVLIIVGYYYAGITYQTDNKELNNWGLIRSKQYRDTIMEGCTYLDRIMFLFDMYKYDYERFFQKVEFQKWDEIRARNRQAHEGYLRSWSFYPIYIENNKDKPGFKDPVQVFHENIANDIGTEDYLINIHQKFFYYILQ